MKLKILLICAILIDLSQTLAKNNLNSHKFENMVKRNH